jgi:hypothetical protein
MASVNGIQIINKDSPAVSKPILSSPLSTVDDKSKRHTIISNEEQNRKDMEALIHCTCWRKLFVYLQSRRAKVKSCWRKLFVYLQSRRASMKSEIGAQLRKSREHINTDR